MNFSLTTLGFNSWGDLTFVNVRATVYGFVVATAFCQETDECGNIVREWKTTKRLDYSISRSEDIGVNPVVVAMTNFPNPYVKILGYITGGSIAAGKISLMTYKVRRQWNSWAESVVNKLLEYGPTIFCLESK